MYVEQVNNYTRISTENSSATKWQENTKAEFSQPSDRRFFYKSPPKRLEFFPVWLRIVQMNYPPGNFPQTSLQITVLHLYHHHLKTIKVSQLIKKNKQQSDKLISLIPNNILNLPYKLYYYTNIIPLTLFSRHSLC